jgi:tripartite-type tricarboxylate transporter receptor subunit TctC
MPYDFTRRSFLGTLAATAGSLPLAKLAMAQGAYPSKQISYVVPYAPGGASDVIARLISEKIKAKSGQPVVLDYKVGASGVIGANFVAKAPADGYTLMAGTNSFFTVIPRTQKIAYDPDKDFIGTAMCGEAYMPFAINPTLPVNSMKELIDYAKKNPGKIAYGSSGVGTIGHLSCEYLKAKTGIDMTHIPYSGGAAALNGVLANEVQICVDTGSAEFILDNKLKGLAMLGKRRWDKLPNVPTIEEAGMPNWGIRSWHTVLVPGGTPAAVVSSLNAIINEALGDKEVLDKLHSFGLEPEVMSPAAVAERIKADKAAFGPILDAAGIKRT